jgi:hypothetical protein
VAALVTYTWGHAMDNASDAGDTPTPPSRIAPTLAAKGVRVFDVRHRLAASVTYQSPGAVIHYCDGDGWPGFSSRRRDAR